MNFDPGAQFDPQFDPLVEQRPIAPPQPWDNKALEYLRRRLSRMPSVTMSPFMLKPPAGVKGEMDDVKFLIDALRGNRDAR